MSAVLTPATPAATPWRVALPALAAVLALLFVLYADTAASMVAIWSRSDTFAHAFLVPPIALWLVWRRRADLARLAPAPQPWLLLPLLAVAALWLLADLVLVNAAAHFALVAMLVLAVPAVLGLQVAFTILFPLLFLFFAVPIGEFMTQPMMDWTADFTVAALRLSGIPVYREGLQFVIPSGQWSVVEACSGVRYLIASFMVGTLFAYLNFNGWKRRLAFMLVSIAVPIVANWVRAYGIVMMGHLSGNTIAVGVDHLVYGWVFFGIVVTVMFMIGARWSEPELPAAAAGAAGHGWPQGAEPAGAGRQVLVAGALALVLALPHLTLWGLLRLEQGAGAPVLALPQALGPRWAAVPPQLPFEPAFQGAHASAAASFDDGRGMPVGVWLGYYRGQGDGAKLVSSVNALVRSQDPQWNQVSSGATRAAVGDRSLPWRTARVLGRAGPGGGRPELTVWRSYWIDGRWVAGDARAKLVGALARLRGRGDDGAVLVLWANAADAAAGAGPAAAPQPAAGPAADPARARLERFLADNLGTLEAQLRLTRDTR